MVRFDAPGQAGRWDWRQAAACRGVGSEEFFGTGPARARGRARCGSCPVSEVCLWTAMVAEELAAGRYGIWGGIGPAGRGRMASVIGPDARVRLVAALVQWHQATRPPSAEENKAG